MRKGWIVLVAVVLVAAIAVPAMADIKASGFYRSKAYIANFTDAAGGPSLRDGETEQTNAFVEQRARVKFEFGTENVRAVWFLESDMIWGGGSGTVARNDGGAIGGDSVQIETKNLYVWFKIPDTSMDFTVGLQSQSDAYAGVLYGGADFAGIFTTGKFQPLSYKFGWAKLFENAEWKTDDVTLYVAETKFSPAKEVALGANFYFLQDQSGKPGATGRLDPFTAAQVDPALVAGPLNNGSLKLYIPGVNATFKAGPATLSAFAFYQWGSFESTLPGVSDVDVRAYGADLRADLAAGPGKVFVEGLYLSGGDDPGQKYEAPITLGDYQANGVAPGPAGHSTFSRTRMQILLPSWDTINISQCFIGCSGGEYGDSPGNGGRGIWHVAAGYSQKFTPKLMFEANVGYMAATKLLRLGDEFRDKDFGTEVNAGLHYNIMQGLDVGVFGAYVFLGDFVKDAPPALGFEDPWTSYARVNYSF